MKAMFKRALSRVAAAPSDSGVRILLYHAVDEADPADYLGLRVRPSEFAAQMELLRAEGYRVVPLRGLLDGLDGGTALTVAITFDDGYRSQLEAATVLERLGFPATFLVVVSFVDGRMAYRRYPERWEHIGWEELRSLAAAGFEIGAHSVSHRDLTRCRPGEIEEETAGARSRLEDGLGRAVTSFSYPYGAWNVTVRRAVEDAGFRLACTSVSGTNRAPWLWFELRRTEISGADRLEDFRRKLQGSYDWLGYWHRWRFRHA